jgi:hypothetical protein
MSKVFNKLNVCIQVLQDLFVFNLQETVDTGWEEHISAVWLPIGACFLQHD